MHQFPLLIHRMWCARQSLRLVRNEAGQPLDRELESRNPGTLGRTTRLAPPPLDRQDPPYCAPWRVNTSRPPRIVHFTLANALTSTAGSVLSTVRSALRPAATRPRGSFARQRAAGAVVSEVRICVAVNPARAINTYSSVG